MKTHRPHPGLPEAAEVAVAIFGAVAVLVVLAIILAGVATLTV